MNNKILQYYFDRSGLSLDYVSSKTHKDFAKFLSGDKQPTFPQVSKIANVLKVPLGLLLINKVIQPSIPEVAFRTINSEAHNSYSKELTDTLEFMQDIQNFLKKETENSLTFVGQFNIQTDYQKLAAHIRAMIDLDSLEQLPNNRAVFLRELRNKINDLGIFVFFNGKYKQNTRRSLDINEFRGFVLVDEKAPVIFINQKDSKNGQIFTLIHELVHIFIGDNEIYGKQDPKVDYDPTEAYVNKVTAEILVPYKKLKELYEKNIEIKQLADTFNVSKFVIARKLFDSGFITKTEYNNKIDAITKEMNENIAQNKSSKGGSYKNNIRYNIDSKFFRYVENAIANKRLSYTDAFSLIGVSYKGYHILKGSM